MKQEKLDNRIREINRELEELDIKMNLEIDVAKWYKLLCLRTSLVEERGKLLLDAKKKGVLMDEDE